MAPDHLPEDTLSALIDAQLSPAEAATAAEHLAGCPTCAGRVTELRSIRDLLRGLPELEIPRDFSLGPRLVQTPSNVIRLQRWYTWTRVAAASLAACFVLLVGGTIYLDSFAPPGRQPVQTTSRADAPASQPAPAAAQRAPATSTPARPAAPALAVPRPVTPATEDSPPEQVAAGTESKPLPTPTPTQAPAPAVVARAPQPAVAAAVDPAAALGAAAAIIGVLAAVATLGAFAVRQQLERAHPED